VSAKRQGKRSTLWFILARWRIWVLLTSTVALNSGLTQSLTKGLPCLALNCHACPLAVTACPIGVIQHFVGQQQVPWYVLGVIGLAGALGGRLACGWFCPFGWLQELVHRLPVPKWRAHPRQRASWWALLAVTVAYAGWGWLIRGSATRSPVLFALYLIAGFALYAVLGASRGFAFVGVVVLVAYVAADTWFCKICPAGILEGGIPWVVIDPGLRGTIGALYWLKVGILFLFLVWMAFTRRPFCRWICPLGAFWSPLNRWSTLQMAVDLVACTRCNRCQNVCPVDIQIYEDGNSPACVRCMQCVVACPVSCISVRGR
jgi:polyferredoxin